MKEERGGLKRPKVWWRIVVAAVTGVAAATAFVADSLGISSYFFPSPAEKSKTVEIEYPNLSPSVTDKDVESDSVSSYEGGWGPERPTFTGDKPPEYAVLNSITDNPVLGDERNFVRVRIYGTSDDFGDFVRAKIGERVELFVAVSNDASDSLDGPAVTIHGLKAEFSWPNIGTDLSVGVTLSGLNVTDVWDGATILTKTPAVLKVVRGSGLMTTNFGTFDLPITGDRLDSMSLGWSSQDGEFPVGYSNDGKYRGYGYFLLTLEVLDPDE